MTTRPSNGRIIKEIGGLERKISLVGTELEKNPQIQVLFRKWQEIRTLNPLLLLFLVSVAVGTLHWPLSGNGS